MIPVRGFVFISDFSSTKTGIGHSMTQARRDFPTIDRAGLETCPNRDNAPAGATRRQAAALIAALLASRLAGGEAKAAGGSYPRLSRGVNIHHMLNWPETHSLNGRQDYVWPPFQAAQYRIENSRLAQLKALGFDFIRLTVDPSILISADDEKWRFLGRHIHEVVAQLLSAGLNVLFDLHPVAVNPDYRPEALVQSEDSAPFRAYVEMVRRVAEILREFPPRRVVFELMNEPRLTNLAQAPQWQTMLERLHASARAAGPELPLMLTGMLWSDRVALMKLDTRPFRGSNVLYTFHYYDPHTFTHQGVKGDDAQFVSGLNWPATKENVAQVDEWAAQEIAARPDLDPAKQAGALARTRQLLQNLLAKNASEETIRHDFKQVADWAQANGLAADQIVLGEFGCVLASNGRVLDDSRLAWLAAVRKTAEANGFGWSYWAYKGYGGMELVDSTGALHKDLIAPLGLTG
jgi:endoglucanase